MTSHKLVMPSDMNPHGFLFGGKMLMWIDEIASIAVARDYPGFAFVTVGMAEATFRKGVPPRSILRFDAERTRVGTTSVTYRVDVFCRPLVEDADETAVFCSDITFVRVDEHGKKCPIRRG